MVELLFILIPIGVVAFLMAGIRIVNPTEKAAILWLGEYSRFANEGFNWIVPILNSMHKLNITQQMVNIEQQEIITSDNLNAKASLVIFYKIEEDEENVKKALFKVTDVRSQIVTLAQTTSRNVMGKISFREVNSERNMLNGKIFDTISKEAEEKYGVNIVKVELKEVEPPKDVQEAMNNVIIAQKDKEAAIDTANAAETIADGKKRAAIKEAEGIRQATILRATGEAIAIKLVNKAAKKYFEGNAQLLKQLEVTQASLKDNAKIVLTEKGIRPVILFGEEKVIPIPRGGDD